MGYGGKHEEQARARALRAAGWTYGEICEELGVAKSSVSLWCAGVEVDVAQLDERRAARHAAGRLTKRPHAQAAAKQAEIEECRSLAAHWLGDLTQRDLLIAGIALYAGEGAKKDGMVKFSNSDPRMIALFLRWLRTFFEVDESRLHLQLYLHQGLDLDAANAHWSGLTGIPIEQFYKPYRAVADQSIKRSKHVYGCPGVSYSCSRTHRLISGLMAALLS